MAIMNIIYIYFASTERKAILLFLEPSFWYKFNCLLKMLYVHVSNIYFPSLFRPHIFCVHT